MAQKKRPAVPALTPASTDPAPIARKTPARKPRVKTSPEPPQPSQSADSATASTAPPPAVAKPERKPRTAKPTETKAPARATTRAPRAKAPARPAVPGVAAPAASAPTFAPSVAADGTPRLSIVMITPEAHPFAKTGGLAEVAAALPDALAALGHDVTIVLPRYRGIDTQGTASRSLAFRLGDRDLSLRALERTLPSGVTLALIDAPDLFDREGLYGDANGDYGDNAWRFAVFSRAALEYVRVRGTRPSILHAHDWQAGLVPVFQKMLFSHDPIVGGVPAVFTIHNLAFQGIFPMSTIGAIGLGWEVLDVQAMEYWGNISYLKGGINFSERISTVSPTYAKEIMEPELGFGFDGILRRRAADVVGILNGIDVTRWDPAADEFVAPGYSEQNLSGKATAKAVLLGAAGIANDPRANVRPLIGLVSRLTDQKGFDLVAAAADELMSLDASWVMLGSGERRYEDLWKSLAAKHPNRVSATIGFDERLAHQIEAGSDLFLMPSRFEPCGLNQLYSLRYGTVPIVRATGGLADTVADAGEMGQGTGFSFSQYTPGALVAAVRRALAAYRHPETWQQMQRRGMQQDHSWDASAREYVKVYRALTAGTPAATP